jgi:hypothetical protein
MAYVLGQKVKVKNFSQIWIHNHLGKQRSSQPYDHHLFYKQLMSLLYLFMNVKIMEHSKWGCQIPFVWIFFVFSLQLGFC